VIPRQCDNDDCDYETGIDPDTGRAQAWWIHAESCSGPVELPPIDPSTIPPSSFAAFLLGISK
jgi:hypothetical protein